MYTIIFDNGKPYEKEVSTLEEVKTEIINFFGIFENIRIFVI